MTYKNEIPLVHGGHVTIGPLLACAIGDAFGAGFEYADPTFVQAHNDLSGYMQHPKWKIPPGSYTDDTQMALGVAEHLLSGHPWTPLRLATRWVRGFHRDQRAGYAGHFYALLQTTRSGAMFLRDIEPHSAKSGGAMRAFPVGFLPDASEVRDKAMFQASLTHATLDGMVAAAAAALMFHHRYYRLGAQSTLAPFLSGLLPGDWHTPWQGPVGAPGLEAVKAALTALQNYGSLSDILRACVAFTGDVDTVAAIAMPTAAVCDETRQDMPQVLIDGLENGLFGRDYLRLTDEKLERKFPRPA